MTAKQPAIRNGQRKPYSKATRMDIEQRIEVADVLRWLRFENWEIRRVLQERYGVEWRQADRYIARARAREEEEPFTVPLA